MKKMLLAMLHCKCPRCYQGDMFKYRLRSLKNPIKPNADCAHCGLHYELEPGFFWGAMYFSYAISVGVSVVAAALLYFMAGDPSTLVYVVVLMGVMLGCSPFSMRYARVLMLYLFGEVNERKQKP